MVFMHQAAYVFFMALLWPLFLGASPKTQEKEAAKALDELATHLRPSPLFVIQPYEANYRVTIPEDGGQAFQFDGDMSVILEEEEDSWSYAEEVTGYLASSTGRVVPFRWSYQTREAKDGTSFRFDYIVTRGKKTVCHHQGHVTYDPLSKKGTVVWEQPRQSRVDIVNDILFPMGLLTKITQDMDSLPHTLSAHMFDGKTQKFLPSVSCFTSQPRVVRWFERDRPSPRNMTVWPVFQAFYMEKTEGERLAPTERRQFLMTRRGVPLKTSRTVDGLSFTCVLRTYAARLPSEAKGPRG
ncbi:DUF1849 family protein [bacterium NHP-B]|nr:DUF1849 family protein [bacterium NHP-B]